MRKIILIAFLFLVLGGPTVLSNKSTIKELFLEQNNVPSISKPAPSSSPMFSNKYSFTASNKDKSLIYPIATVSILC